jgi:hypothetical protein
MSTDSDHVHKYKKILIGKKDYYVYKCVQNGCAHYLPLKAAIGRQTVCWGQGPDCKGFTFITEKNVELKTLHPMCEPCREWRKEQRESLQTIPMIEGEIEE